MAGPMALVLPDALGNVSALETYLAAGLIVQESGGAGQMGESLAQDHGPPDCRARGGQGRRSGLHQPLHASPASRL